MLGTRGIDDIDKLAATSVDDLVDYLDVSFDEAEGVLQQAQAVVAARDDASSSHDNSSSAGVDAEANESDDASTNDAQ